MTSSLNRLLTEVTTQPGVYLMKDDTGKVIYVGKARNLKKRLGSYFRPQNGISDRLDRKTRMLIRKIDTFETIITGNEKEALVLESNLIKRYRPRYNVILKDDKRYPSLRLDTDTPFPNLTVVRKTDKKNAVYFGPYPSATAVRETLKLINRTFKLRKCRSKNPPTRPRPCLNHQMGLCLGPCGSEVDPALYKSVVDEVVLFLKGKTTDLIKNIKKEMATAADAKNYERAAVLRDKLFALEKTLEKQVAVTTDFQDRDVIGLSRSFDVSMITLLNIRDGYLMGTRQFSFSETLATEAEIIETFIRQYYEKTSFIPGEILSPHHLDDRILIENWLSDIKGRKVSILFPKRGEKHRLVQLAVENAQKRLNDHYASVEKREEILTRLQKHLGLQKIPYHIECFDNSTFGGKEPVASCVVFKNGQSSTADYRKYKIKTVSVPNDYAYMAEVLGRRYGKQHPDTRFPDLLMVDGGKGQLNIALAIVKELGLMGNFDIIGIAKKDETKGEPEDKIYIKGRSNPINFNRAGDLLLFLQSIRDEAHRFAITFQRNRRKKAVTASVLDTIPGIGKKRKTALLKHFGGITRIRNAAVDEVMSVPGISRTVAETVKDYLSR